ncbi:MAG: flagellar basal body L-ring protein FlgH [Opitutaceae bacterium]|nr:flagellar basal body L-ring protein FlgH [Verrucomicrobiales bacterium]
MNKPSLSLSKVAAVILLSALPLTSSAQSLWKDDSSRSMFADKRARSVGDIITVLVQESNAATKENNTKTSKNVSVDAALQTFLYSPAGSSFLTKNGQMPALKAYSKNSFDGGGQINNSERITTRLAVRVVDTLPNGNLIIEGKRQTVVAGETTDAVLRGTVRAEDVTANNTIFSYNIADARIQFLSKGSLSDSQRKGWFLRIWDKLTPF